MTRAEIHSMVGLLLREQLGTAGSGDPFTLDLLIDAVANEVAKRTDCYWDSVTTDLTANKLEYCISNLYKIKAAFRLNAAGKWVPLVCTRPDHVDNYLGAWWWRNAPAADTTSVAAFEGTRAVKLYPTPSITRTAGFAMEGFMTPEGLWPGDGDECPLPDWAHMAVVYGVCEKRCLQFIGEIPTAQIKAAAWKPQYRSERGDCEQKAANLAPKSSLFLPGTAFGMTIV